MASVNLVNFVSSDEEERRGRQYSLLSSSHLLLESEGKRPPFVGSFSSKRVFAPDNFQAFRYEIGVSNPYFDSLSSSSTHSSEIDPLSPPSPSDSFGPPHDSLFGDDSSLLPINTYGSSSFSPEPLPKTQTISSYSISSSNITNDDDDDAAYILHHNNISDAFFEARWCAQTIQLPHGLPLNIPTMLNARKKSIRYHALKSLREKFGTFSVVYPHSNPLETDTFSLPPPLFESPQFGGGTLVGCKLSCPITHKRPRWNPEPDEEGWITKKCRREQPPLQVEVSVIYSFPTTTTTPGDVTSLEKQVTNLSFFDYKWDF